MTDDQEKRLILDIQRLVCDRNLLLAVLREVDDEVRHHLRSDEVAPALIRRDTVQGVRDVVNQFKAT